MAVRRGERQDAIRAIVRRKAIGSYEQLAEELHAMGHRSADGTIARDIAEIGLTKVDGIYVLGSDMELKRMLSRFVTGCERVGNLVVARTERGVEQAVATSIDAACLPDVVCAVMGIGAVLVVCRSDEGASSVAAMVEVLR